MCLADFLNAKAVLIVLRFTQKLSTNQQDKLTSCNYGEHPTLRRGLLKS
jgi:hypothetical protein